MMMEMKGSGEKVFLQTTKGLAKGLEAATAAVISRQRIMLHKGNTKGEIERGGKCNKNWRAPGTKIIAAGNFLDKTMLAPETVNKALFKD